MECYLYPFGYLFTNNMNLQLDSIGIDIVNWKNQQIDGFQLYAQNKETYFLCEAEGRYLILVGHAYNPFTMESDENEILRSILSCNSENEYREYIDQLTGIFVLITLHSNGHIEAICDCAGMMGAYYCVIGEHVYISSHAQLIDDLLGFTEDPYVTALKKSPTFHFYGLFLPNDLSPYKEIKRIIPNVEVRVANGRIELNRFYPRKKYSLNKNYEDTVRQVAELLHKNLVLITKKWNHPAVSLTGGTDSKTTLACAGDVQDKFLYYSYISLPREATDAKAAHTICDSLGLRHEIYEIDTNPENYPDYSKFDKLIERQYAYLGKGNPNDVCKRIGLIEQFNSDIEVKSWVSEVARASRYNIYGKDRFSDCITPRMLTSMYKVFTYDRWNVIRTDKQFKDYLDNTELRKRIKETGYPWTEFFVWEIVFGGWGGLTLSAEHKVSNNITVPYNNRAIIDLMLRTPLEKRRSDQLHRDIMDAMDPRINKLGIHIINGNESKKRQIAERLYFDVNSHIPF